LRRSDLGRPGEGRVVALSGGDSGFVRLPISRQHIVEVDDGMVTYATENISKPGLRVHLVEHCGLDEL